MILIHAPGSTLGGTLTYKNSEHSFMFDVASPADLLDYAGGHEFASVSLGTLQVEFGVKSKRALFAWGYHPRQKWLASALTLPDLQSGALYVTSDYSLESGVSFPLAPVGAWETMYDSTSGWLRICADPSPDEDVILIADGIALGCVNCELHSIWLRPIFD